MTRSADPNADETAEHTEPEHRQGTGAGDDERENREKIDRTGEPQRDALGNADGAS